jgi:CHAT domain-containing protein/Flp pilus assembly protein TadD
MRSNIFASGLAIVLGVGSPIVTAVVSPEVATAQSTANLNNQSVQLLAKGKEQYRQADFRSAIATYQQAIKQAEQQGTKLLQARAMAELGRIYAEIDHKQEAEALILRGLKLARESGDQQVEADVLDNLAGFYQGQQDLIKAKQFAQELQAVSEATNNPKGIVNAKISQTAIRWLKFLQQKQFKQALIESQALLKLTQTNDDQDQIADAYVSQWFTYKLLEDTSQAETLFQQIRSTYKATGYRLMEYKVLKAAGDLTDAQKQSAQKLAYYQLSLAVAQSANNPWFHRDLLIEIGLIYVNQKQLEKGLGFYQQALTIAQTIDDDAIGSVQNRIGIIYYRAEKYSEALVAYQKAIVSYQKAQNQSDLAQVWRNMGEAYGKQKKFSQAREAYQQALAIAQSTNNLMLQVSLLSSISQTYGAEAKDMETNHHNYLQAIKLYQQKIEIGQQALVIVRQIPDRNWEIEILRGIAISYNGQGMALSLAGQDPAKRLILSDEALQFSQQALVIAKDLKDDKNAKSILSFIRLVHDNKASSYQELKQYDNALAQVNLMHVAAKESGDLKDEKHALTREALIYGDLASFYPPEQYDKRIEVSEKVIALKKQLNTPEFEWLQYENKIANVYEFRGQYEKGLTAYEHILTRAQAIHDVKGEFYALSGIGSIHKAQADYAKAASFYEKALQLSRTQRDNDTNESVILNNIAILIQVQGRYSQALATAQQSLHMVEKEYEQYAKGMTPGNIREICLEYNSDKRSSDFNAEVCDHPDKPLPGFVFNQIKDVIDTFAHVAHYRMGVTLGNIGRIYYDQGDYHKSIQYYQKALEISRELKEPSQEAVSYNNLGKTYSDLGQYEKARESLLKGLKIVSAQRNLELEVVIHSNLGKIASVQGDYSAALNEYQQALTLGQKAKMQSREAVTLSRIGDVYQSQGNYALASDNYQNALVIQERIHEPANIIETKLQYGSLQRQLGQRKEALATHQEALALAQKIGAKQLEAKAILAIATDYREQGQLDNALKGYNQALEIATSIDDLNAKPQALYGIGQLNAQQNQPEKALTYLNQALVIQQRTGVKPRQAQTLSAIGQVQTQLGQLAEAQTNLQESLIIAQSVGDRATQALAISHLAELATKQNQSPLAIVLYKQSVIQYETIRKGLAPLPKDQQESYTRTVAQTYRNLADLLIQQNRLLEAQQILGLLKLQEIKDYSPTTRNALQDNEVKLNDIEKEIAKKYGNLIAFRQNLDQCQGKINNADCEKLDRDRDQQGKAFNDFLASLKSQVNDRCQKNQEENCIAPSNKFTSAANKMIAAQPGSLVIMPVVLDNKIWILTIAENGLITRYESNVDRLTLGKKVLELRQQLETPNSDIKELQTTSKQLYDWLIRPIEPTLTAAKTPPKLIFALDRVTRYIPMGVLYDGQQYLTQRYPISTILSIETTNTNKSTIGNLTTTNVLALGLSKAVGDFRALPSVNPELASIVQKSGIYPGQVLLNQDFTRSNLSNNLNNRNILHIATHGKFDPTQPKGSYLVLGNGDKLPIADISTLDYSKLDLVVLSACQTALGNPDQDGTEIPGISSHFLNNGAASVMASLWSVDDASTALMMQGFYRNLSQNKPKNEALRQAQLDLLKLDTTQATQSAIVALPRFSEPLSELEAKAPSSTRNIASGYSHPYYWAPFILIGNSQ